jgi:hypothetical protein
MHPSQHNISGNWLGHFQYGPEYGDFAGEKVSFTITIEMLVEGQFRGTSQELEGPGMNPHPASIQGYIDGTKIHFTKEYPVDYILEDDGKMEPEKLSRKSLLIYDGEYYNAEQIFKGVWEIEISTGPSLTGEELSICTGGWEMARP